MLVPLQVGRLPTALLRAPCCWWTDCRSPTYNLQVLGAC
jgi:hypothetical protein